MKQLNILLSICYKLFDEYAVNLIVHINLVVCNFSFLFLNFLILFFNISYLLHMFKVAFVGFITCTMYLRTRMHPTNELNGSLYLSCLFYGLVHMMFNGFSELPLMISRLPVFYKQRDNLFHPAWAWSIASWILRVPYSIIESVVWSCVVYFSVGFAPGAGR